MDLNNSNELGTATTAEPAGQQPDIPPTSQHRALLEEVYRRYKRDVVRMLCKHAGSVDAAESLFHEACRITLERLIANGISDTSRLAGFLYGTARRLALADRRLFDNSRTDSADATLESIPGSGTDPEVSRDAESLATAVRELLKELPAERDRHLLTRIYLQEEDRDQVCAELDLTAEQFSRVLFRAKMRFRSILERHGLDTFGLLPGLLLLACAVLALSMR